MSDDDADGEIVAAAQRLHDGSLSLQGFLDVFLAGFVYARTPAEAPRLYVAELADGTRWACVFTSMERLAASVGECDYLGMSGAEFVGLVPSGVGLVVDVEDAHAVTLPASLIHQVATQV